MTARMCPECGQSFTLAAERKRGRPPTFCATDHQKTFHSRNAARGKVLLPLALVWAGGRHGSREERAYARARMSELLGLYVADDKANGRRPDLLVAEKLALQWRAVDLL